MTVIDAIYRAAGLPLREPSLNANPFARLALRTTSGVPCQHGEAIGQVPMNAVDLIIERRRSRSPNLRLNQA